VLNEIITLLRNQAIKTWFPPYHLTLLYHLANKKHGARTFSLMLYVKTTLSKDTQIHFEIITFLHLNQPSLQNAHLTVYTNQTRPRNGE